MMKWKLPTLLRSQFSLCLCYLRRDIPESSVLT